MQSCTTLVHFVNNALRVTAASPAAGCVVRNRPFGVTGNIPLDSRLHFAAYFLPVQAAGRRNSRQAATTLCRHASSTLTTPRSRDRRTAPNSNLRSPQSPLAKGWMAMKDQITVLSNGLMGDSPFDEIWEIGLSMNPDVIAVQGTSSDTGPHYLGTNTLYGGSLGIKRGLRTIMTSAKKKRIPFILSTGSPSGGNHQLEKVLTWANEIAREEKINLRIAVIGGELDKEYLRHKIRAGVKIRRLVDADTLSEYLTEKDVNASAHIVAQLGPEPIVKALRSNVDGVITGRALDIALHMAVPLREGFDKGLAAHMAKTLECGSQVTIPETLDGVIGILRKDHFLVKPTNPHSKCTPLSVVAHAFYERANPYREENPGGALDITQATYEQYDDVTTKVFGSRWIPAPYTVKLEGARQIGYRAISIMGIRDERMIRQVDFCIEEARKHTEAHLKPLKHGIDYDLSFRIYGKNAVLGDKEPVKETKAHEICLIVEGVAPSEEVAENTSEIAGRKLLHMDYPGRIATAANVAHPYSPSVNNLGPVYSWNIWHLLPLEDPCEPFKIEIRQLG